MTRHQPITHRTVVVPEQPAGGIAPPNSPESFAICHKVREAIERGETTPVFRVGRRRAKTVVKTEEEDEE